MKARIQEKKEGESFEVKLVPDTDLQPSRIYANFMDVNHGPYDFTLRFGDAGPIYDLEAIKRKKEHRVPLVAEIAVPTSIVPAIINALSSQWEKYQKNYGKVENAEQDQNKENDALPE